MILCFKRFCFFKLFYFLSKSPIIFGKYKPSCFLYQIAVLNPYISFDVQISFNTFLAAGTGACLKYKDSVPK